MTAAPTLVLKVGVREKTYNFQCTADGCRWGVTYTEAEMNAWSQNRAFDLKSETEKRWLEHNRSEHLKSEPASSWPPDSASSSPMAATLTSWKSRLVAFFVRFVAVLPTVFTRIAGRISWRSLWLVSVWHLVTEKGLRGSASAHRYPVWCWPESWRCSRCGGTWDFDPMGGPPRDTARMVHTCRSADDGLWENRIRQ